jgi:hypothetical protein
MSRSMWFNIKQVGGGGGVDSPCRKFNNSRVENFVSWCRRHLLIETQHGRSNRGATRSLLCIKLTERKKWASQQCWAVFACYCFDVGFGFCLLLFWRWFWFLALSIVILHCFEMHASVAKSAASSQGVLCLMKHSSWYGLFGVNNERWNM